MTPVFDRERKILGYFEEPDEVKTEQNFAVRCLPKNGFTKLSEWPARDVRHNRRDETHLLPTVCAVQFERAVVCVVRDMSGMFHCDVLTTNASADELNRLRGFKWFAEQHGNFRAATGAVVA